MAAIAIQSFKIFIIKVIDFFYVLFLIVVGELEEDAVLVREAFRDFLVGVVEFEIQVLKWSPEKTCGIVGLIDAFV